MKVIASGLLALGLLAVQISEADAAACAAGRYQLGASGHVARWLPSIGLTATTAPQWCAQLMARTAIGAAACASAARQPSFTHAGRRSRSPLSLYGMRREAVTAVDGRISVG